MRVPGWAPPQRLEKKMHEPCSAEWVLSKSADSCSVDWASVSTWVKEYQWMGAKRRYGGAEAWVCVTLPVYYDISIPGCRGIWVKSDLTSSLPSGKALNVPRAWA